MTQTVKRATRGQTERQDNLLGRELDHRQSRCFRHLSSRLEILDESKITERKDQVPSLLTVRQAILLSQI